MMSFEGGKEANRPARLVAIKDRWASHVTCCMYVQGSLQPSCGLAALMTCFHSYSTQNATQQAKGLWSSCLAANINICREAVLGDHLCKRRHSCSKDVCSYG